MHSDSKLDNPSVVVVGPKTSEIRHLPYPKVSDGNDAIVAVHYVGVCGSDVKFFRPSSCSALTLSRGEILV